MTYFHLERAFFPHVVGVNKGRDAGSLDTRSTGFVFLKDNIFPSLLVSVHLT